MFGKSHTPQDPGSQPGQPASPAASETASRSAGRRTRGGVKLSDVQRMPAHWLAAAAELEGAAGFDLAEPIAAEPLEALNIVDAPERELLEDMAEEAGRDAEALILHSCRVAALSAVVARELGCGIEAALVLRRAAVLHDLGELSIPERREGRPVTEERLETEKLHTVFGADLLEGCTLPVLRLAREIALGHHERWNGSGYPDALEGEATPLSARIVALADEYDELTHEGADRPAWSSEAAVLELARQRGRAHEAAIVDAFLRVVARAGEPSPFDDRAA